MGHWPSTANLGTLGGQWPIDHPQLHSQPGDTRGTMTHWPSTSPHPMWGHKGDNDPLAIHSSTANPGTLGGQWPIGHPQLHSQPGDTRGTMTHWPSTSPHPMWGHKGDNDPLAIHSSTANPGTLGGQWPIGHPQLHSQPGDTRGTMSHWPSTAPQPTRGH